MRGTPVTDPWEDQSERAVDEARAARRAEARRRRYRRRRGLALAVVAAVVVIVAIIALGGGSSRPRPRTNGRTGAPAGTQASTAIQVVAAGTLPAPVQFPAAAALADGRVVLLGGLDGSENSTAAITTLSGGRSMPNGTLPAPQHDAQAATLANAVYVFGGGAAESYDHILRFDPATGQVTQAGRLPEPASDVAVASIGDRAYVIGGYNGTSALDTIVSWSPGEPARVVAHLPASLRYAAAASVDGRVIVAAVAWVSGAGRCPIGITAPVAGSKLRLASAGVASREPPATITRPSTDAAAA